MWCRGHETSEFQCSSECLCAESAQASLYRYPLRFSFRGRRQWAQPSKSASPHAGPGGRAGACGGVPFAVLLVPLVPCAVVVAWGAVAFSAPWPCRAVGLDVAVGARHLGSAAPDLPDRTGKEDLTRAMIVA